MSEVRRWCSRYAAGTESARAMIDTFGRTQPDADESEFYVLASDYDALAARLAEAERLLRTAMPQVHPDINAAIWRADRRAWLAGAQGSAGGSDNG